MTAREGVARLHTEEVGGDGPETPLVVLHGLFGQSRNFKSWARSLTSDPDCGPRRVVLADLRNHGSSEQRDSMTYEEMAGDVVAMLDFLGIQKAVLLGHSMGGKVAMACALLHPDRVERLVIVDMAPVSYVPGDGSAWEETLSVLEAMSEVDVAALRSKGEADAAIARNGVSNPDLRAFVLTNLEPNPRGGETGLRWKVNLPAIRSAIGGIADWAIPAPAEADRFRGNTLFIAGGRSQYVRSTHLDAIAEHFETYSLTKIKDAGHWVHADAPGALAAITCNFLNVPNKVK